MPAAFDDMSAFAYHNPEDRHNLDPQHNLRICEQRAGNPDTEISAEPNLRRPACVSALMSCPAINAPRQAWRSRRCQEDSESQDRERQIVDRVLPPRGWPGPFLSICATG